MKKTLILIMLVMFVISLFAADDLEMNLSGNASTDHFTVKDNSSNTLFIVRGNGVVNIPTLSSAPASPTEGDMYTNSTSHEIFYYDGSSWQSLVGVTSEIDPTLTDDGNVTIGDGASNPIKLTFSGTSSADIFYDSSFTTLKFEIGSHNVLQTIHSSGIVDFNKQSRARGYLIEGQAIPSGTWTAIDFDNENYDEHAEFTTGSPAYFTATEAGYYQVNARTGFFLGGNDNNYWVDPNSYVSIAIYKNNNMYAQGNNLQIGQVNTSPTGAEPSLQYNNAPNVSDVVKLDAGDTIEIYCWQNSGIVLDLVTGSSKTYVSIHKLS